MQETWCEDRAVVRKEERVQNPSSASAPSVPTPLTAWIGRASELEALSDLLRRSRLVTLTGPGGVGKTRLAVEVGRRQARRRADGVWLVDLASVAAPEDVAAETARVLDVRGAARDATNDALRRHLGDRDTLLLFDNCGMSSTPVPISPPSSCAPVRTFAFWQPAVSRSAS